MAHKERGILDLLFGDLLFVLTIKRDFRKNNVFSRSAYACISLEPIQNKFIQQTKDVICGPVVKKIIPHNVDTLQMIAKNAYPLMIGLANLYVHEFHKNDKQAEKVVESLTQIYLDRYPGYQVKDSNFKEYVNSLQLHSMSRIYAQRIADRFDIKEERAIHLIASSIADVYLEFIDAIEPAFNQKTDALVSHILKDTTPWVPLVVLVGIIMSVFVVNIINEDTQKDGPNSVVTACRVSSDSCYTLKAHYVSEQCADVDYTTRGPTGGQCLDNDFIKTIYFDNGGYREFSRNDCDALSQRSWKCVDADENTWEISLQEF